MSVVLDNNSRANEDQPLVQRTEKAEIGKDRERRHARIRHLSEPSQTQHLEALILRPFFRSSSDPCESAVGDSGPVEAEDGEQVGKRVSEFVHVAVRKVGHGSQVEHGEEESRRRRWWWWWWQSRSRICCGGRPEAVVRCIGVDLFQDFEFRRVAHDQIAIGFPPRGHLGSDAGRHVQPDLKWECGRRVVCGRSTFLDGLEQFRDPGSVSIWVERVKYARLAVRFGEDLDAKVGQSRQGRLGRRSCRRRLQPGLFPGGIGERVECRSRFGRS